jgi:hypothetical protein
VSDTICPEPRSLAPAISITSESLQFSSNVMFMNSLEHKALEACCRRAGCEELPRLFVMVVRLCASVRLLRIRYKKPWH